MCLAPPIISNAGILHFFVYVVLEKRYKTKQYYEAIYVPKHITFTYRNTLFWG